MIEFLRSILVIALVLIREIVCSDSLQAVLPSYYDSEIQQPFKKEWQKYQHAFENAVVSGLQENFGSSAVNIYVAERYDSQHIAVGFHLNDGVVNVYFHQMILRELPDIVRPMLKIELPSNHLKFESKVGRMFIDTTYYVARNTSSVIYAHPEDQKTLSPFSLQQVETSGKVTIIAEDCTLSGISIVTLNGESVILGHSPIQLGDCKFTVEISTPNSGAPPVIAPYFPKGPKEKLELILGKPIIEELKTKLQGAMYSYVNTTVLFGEQVSNFRNNQHKLFSSYADFIKTYVSRLNQKTLKSSKIQVGLEDYVVYMDATSEGQRRPCHLSLTGLVLYGLETAYVSRTGGPYNDRSPDLAADAIVFSSMQIRGKATHVDNDTITADFAAEITDVTVNIVINVAESKLRDINLAGWRSLEFSLIPWKTDYTERINFQSLVYGHILNVLPTRIISHVKSILENKPIDDGKQDSGSGANHSDGDMSEDKDGGNNSKADDNNNNDSSNLEPSQGSVSDVDNSKDKEFFTDDLLDKDFFTDDNLDKGFFTGENVKAGVSSDDKTGVGNDDIDTNTEENVDDNQKNTDGVDEGVSDTNDSENVNAEGTESINADEKSVSDSTNDVKAQADESTGSTDGGVDKIGESNDNINGGDDDGVVADTDPGVIANDGKKDFFTDDNIEEAFFTDDNIKQGFLSSDKSDGNEGANKGIGSDSSISDVEGRDKVGNMSSDGGNQGEVNDRDMSSDDGGKVDGSDNDESEIAGGQIENNVGGNTGKSLSEKNNFFSDDHIEKNFFSDDNIKKNFFTDDNVEKNFFSDDKGHANDNDKKHPNDKNDEDSEDNESSNIKTDQGEKLIDNNSGTLSDENNGKKYKVKKDFFTDDNLDKDFFTDDKDFFTDKNIKGDFFPGGKLGNMAYASSVDEEADDTDGQRVSNDDEEHDRENGASFSNNDNTSDDEVKDEENEEEDDKINNGKSSESADSSVSNYGNAEAQFKLKENKNKLTKSKLFLDENFFNDDNLDKGFMEDEIRRRVGKDNVTAVIKNENIKHVINDNHDTGPGTTGIANVSNKKTNTENIGKQNVNEDKDLKEAKKNVLPLNVHNARRFDNLHMSENEIR